MPLIDVAVENLTLADEVNIYLPPTTGWSLAFAALGLAMNAYNQARTDAQLDVINEKLDIIINCVNEIAKLQEQIIADLNMLPQIISNLINQALLEQWLAESRVDLLSALNEAAAIEAQFEENREELLNRTFDVCTKLNKLVFGLSVTGSAAAIPLLQSAILALTIILQKSEINSVAKVEFLKGAKLGLNICLDHSENTIREVEKSLEESEKIYNQHQFPCLIYSNNYYKVLNWATMDRTGQIDDDQCEIFIHNFTLQSDTQFDENMRKAPFFFVGSTPYTTSFPQQVINEVNTIKKNYLQYIGKNYKGTKSALNISYTWKSNYEEIRNFVEKVSDYISLQN